MRIIFSLFFFCNLALGGTNFSPKGLTAIWDTLSGAGILNGGGTWDSTSRYWNYDGGGTANSRFCPGCNVSFGRTGSTGNGGAVTVSGTQLINSMTFGYVDSGNYTLSGGELSCVNTSSCTYTANVSGTIGSLISGSKLLLKEGTQTLTLSGANTYTGNTTVSKGTLATTNNNSLGSSTGTTTLGDANTGANNITLTNSAGSLTQSIFTVPNQGTGTVTFEQTAANAGLVGNIVLNRPTTFQSNFVGAGGAYFGAFNNTTVTSGNVGTLTVKALQSGLAYVPGNNTFVGSVLLPQGSVYTFHNGAFGGSGNSVTMSGTSLLGLYGANLTIGDLTGASGNSVDNDVSGTNTLTISSANSATFAGVISGAGALIKSGMGTETLSGNNTYTGNTTINGGTLYLGNGPNNIIPATNLITNDSILIYNTPSTITHSGIISGTGSFEKLGTGVLTLSGVNSYLGGTTVSAGTLQETTTVSAFPGNVAIAAGATAWLNVTGTQSHPNTFTGAGTLKVTAGGTGSTTTSLSGNLSGLTGTLEVNPFGSGGGKVNITTATQANTMPAGSLVRVQSGGTIYYPNALNYAAGVQLNGGTTGEAIGNLRVEGNATVTGPISLLTNSTIGTYISTGYISGVISGVGFGFTKEHSGNLILTNNNTYTGTTTHTGGTLTLGDGTDAGNIIPAPNAVTGTAALVYNTGSNISHSGVISGTGTFAKQGSGTLTLSAANTYTGATTVTTGTLKLTNTNTSPTYNIATGTVLELNTSSATRDGGSSQTFNGAGTLRKTGANSIVWGGNIGTFALGSGALIDIQEGSFTGGSNANEVWTSNLSDLNVASGAAFNGVEENIKVDALTGTGTISSGLVHTRYTIGFTFGVDGGSGSFGGVLANTDASNAGKFIKEGNGTQILTGVNTYTGNTTISAGTLQISGAGNLASGSYAGAISNTGTFRYSSSADQTLSGGISGAGSLIKDTNNSTLTLSGNGVTYTGATTIDAGTLSLNNTYARFATGGITLNSGGTLNFHAPSAWGGESGIHGTVAGAGLITKTGTNTVAYGCSSSMKVNQSAGAFTDIQQGKFQANCVKNAYGNPNLGSLNIAAGATFDVFADTDQFDALTGAGILTNGYPPNGVKTVTLGVSNTTNNATYGVANNTATFSGVIDNADGNIAIVKTGTGTQILTGVNTYTGTTAINGGTLQIADAGLLGSGNYAGAISNSGIFQYSSSGSQTLSGAITGAGSIIKDTSTSGLTLSGANTYTGPTTLNAGQIQVFAPSGLGSTSAITIGAGTTLLLNTNGSGQDYTRPVIFSGSTGNLHLSQTTTPRDNTWSGNMTLTGDAHIYGIKAGGLARLTGVLTGAGALTTGYQGAFYGGNFPSIFFTGNNSYTGGTTIYAGFVVGSHANAFGTGTITLGNASSGGNDMTLQLNAANINNPITVSTSGTGTKTIYGPNHTQGQNGMITVPLGAAVTLQSFDSGGTDHWFAFNGKLTGAGTINLKSGATPGAPPSGTRISMGNATSDFSGDVVLVSGRIQVNAGNSFGTGLADLNTGTAGTSDMRLWSPATYTLPVNQFTGSGEIYNDGGGTATLSVGNNNGSSTYSGVIRQNVALVKEGTGTQTLTGQNLYTRGTTVNGGTLSLTYVPVAPGGATTSAIKGDLIINSGGTVTAPTPWTFGYSELATEAVKSITINGGTLNFTGAASGGGTNSIITMTNGSITGSLFDYFTLSGARTITINAGTSTISSGMDHRIPGGLTFDVAAGGTLNFSGIMSQEATPGDVIKAGPGLMNMTGVNTYTVPTTISAGTFQISGAGSLGPAASYAGAISIASGANLKYSSSTDQTLSGAITGTGTLTKDTSSTSTLTLTSASTNYTGATTISAGTLTLVDTTAFNSAITNNGTLILNRSAGFTARDNIGGTAVSGTGTMNINSAANTAGTSDGGWVIFGGTTSFTGTGPVNINSGVLSRDNTNPSNINSSADYTVLANAVFAAGRGGNSNIGGLNGAGTVCACWTTAGMGYITFGNGNKSGTFSGTIRGNGGTVDGALDGGIMNVIKTGSGTQTLSGANTYTGSTTVNDGTLKLQNTIGYKTTNLIVNTGGTLQIDFVTGGTLSTAPEKSFETVVANVTGAGTVSYSCPATKYCSGGYAAGEFNNNLDANGQINILSGSMQWGWDHGSHLTNMGSLNVAAGAEFRSSNAIFQFDKIEGSGKIGNAYDTAVTLRIGVNNGTSTFSGQIVNGDSYNGRTTGALTLVKQGTGTITLNGASTYTGGTTISTGRIICGIAGALGTGSVAVSAGAIFTKGPCTNATSGAGTVN